MLDLLDRILPCQWNLQSCPEAATPDWWFTSHAAQAATHDLDNPMSRALAPDSHELTAGTGPFNLTQRHYQLPAQQRVSIIGMSHLRPSRRLLTRSPIKARRRAPEQNGQIVSIALTASEGPNRAPLGSRIPSFV